MWEMRWGWGGFQCKQAQRITQKNIETYSSRIYICTTIIHNTYLQHISICICMCKYVHEYVRDCQKIVFIALLAYKHTHWFAIFRNIIFFWTISLNVKKATIVYTHCQSERKMVNGIYDSGRKNEKKTDIAEHVSKWFGVALRRCKTSK